MFSGLLFFLLLFFSLLGLRILRAPASRKLAEYNFMREKVKYLGKAMHFFFWYCQTILTNLPVLNTASFSTRACPVLTPKGLIVDGAEFRVLGYQAPY